MRFFYNQALCSKCPIQKLECGTGELDDVEQMIVAVEAVERWSTQHPIKTRQSEFLKIYPGTVKINGIIGIEPCKLENVNGSVECCLNCDECKKRYWLAEVEE